MNTALPDNIRMIPCGTVNCYVLRGEKGSILIDTAIPGHGKTLLKLLKGENIKLIIITHGHMDHIGSAAYLAEKLSVPVAVHRADEELITRPDARVLHGHTVMGRIMEAVARLTLKKQISEHFIPTVFPEDGDSLGEYGVAARVISLPGHTAGSIGVLTDDGSLIAGDAFFCIPTAHEAQLFEDRQQMKQSVKKALAAASVILPGHGKPFTAASFKMSTE